MLEENVREWLEQGRAQGVDQGIEQEARQRAGAALPSDGQKVRRGRGGGAGRRPGRGRGPGAARAGRRLGHRVRDGVGAPRPRTRRRPVGRLTAPAGWPQRCGVGVKRWTSRALGRPRASIRRSAESLPQPRIPNFPDVPQRDAAGLPAAVCRSPPHRLSRTTARWGPPLRAAESPRRTSRSSSPHGTGTECRGRAVQSDRLSAARPRGRHPLAHLPARRPPAAPQHRLGLPSCASSGIRRCPKGIGRPPLHRRQTPRHTCLGRLKPSPRWNANRIRPTPPLHPRQPQLLFFPFAR